MSRPTTARRVFGGYLMIGSVSTLFAGLVALLADKPAWWWPISFGLAMLILGVVLVQLPDSSDYKTLSQLRRERKRAT